MLRFITIPLAVILTSFYFFPVEFSFLPGINTKMMEAVLGLILFLFQFARSDSGFLDNNIAKLAVWALIVSLFGFAAVTVNTTPDFAYAMYFVSAAVWVAGAYFVVNFIGFAHDRQSPTLVMNYLIAVCVIQCVLAVVIDTNASVRLWVDSHFLQGQDFLKSNTVRRLYGIGASLDVAGSRFAAVLTMIAFLLVYYSKKLPDFVGQTSTWLYVISFFAIAVIGNMVARTTLVGVIVALVYLALNFKYVFVRADGRINYLFFWISVFLLLLIPLSIYLYNNDAFFHKQIRFAFEGFFNLFEKGEWEVDSTEKLKTMYVFPDNLKTWLIGDGYFSNPRDTDPYYIGQMSGGYYMGTDVGYLRFTFYFGVFGTLAFCYFMYQAYLTCADRFPSMKMLFLLILAINYIVWFKVSTDLFLVFALFICIEKQTDPVSLDPNKLFRVQRK